MPQLDGMGGRGAEKVGKDRERAEGKTCPTYGQGCVYGVDVGWGCPSQGNIPTSLISPELWKLLVLPLQEETK